MFSTSHIADILKQISVFLQLKGENPFKVRAYEQGAHVLEGLTADLGLMIRNGQLQEVPGIGRALAEKIKVLYETGSLPDYEALKASIPAGLIACLDVPGLGPKKAYVLHQQLGIDSLDALAKACENGQIASIKGFGDKTQTHFLEGIRRLKLYAQRHLRQSVVPIVDLFLSFLRGLPEVKQVDCAGSFRRGCETVGDLDFVLASLSPETVMQAFVTHPLAAEKIAQGPTKSSIRLNTGLQIDLRIVPEGEYPFALHHFTGSKNHHIELRSQALKQGLSLSEWGIRPSHSEGAYATYGIQTEDELFHQLGLNPIIPELREGMGEVAYAQHNIYPSYIEKKDIQGAFHNHTQASDGQHTLDQMVEAAQALGWAYIGIADHSRSSFQAHGLSEERLMEQVAYIHQLNKSQQYRPYIFSGTECDILTDGTLDYDNSILEQLDYVVASVHSSFSQDEKTMTNRIIKALENPYTTMLGHLTGRLLLKRKGYEVDAKKIIDAAIANKKIIELNANPFRLDMDWRLWRQAVDTGLLCSINPDAHSTSDLNFIYDAVVIARKGLLTASRVLNTWPLERVKAYLNHR